MSEFRRHLMKGVFGGEPSPLPSGYKMCNYIYNQSSGNNVGLIYTGVYWITDVNKIVCNFWATPTNNYCRIFGTAEVGSGRVPFIRITTNNTIYTTKNWSGIDTGISLADNFTDLEMTEYGFSYNGHEYANNYNQLTPTLNIQLLGAKNAGGNDVYISSCKLYNVDTIVRNYIACYRESDGVAGLWDTITETFNSGTKNSFLHG